MDRPEGREHFWSETYRGHHIALQRGDHAWRVVSGHVVEKDLDFGTAEEAAAWLRRRVDARIAEAIFPGLARA